MTLQVTISRTDRPSEVATFPEGQAVVVGRGERCTLRIDDPSVSRTHVALVLRDDELFVEDRSTNGTLVGDSWLRCARTQIRCGTPLKIGSITLVPSRLEGENASPSRSQPSARAEQGARRAAAIATVPPRAAGAATASSHDRERASKRGASTQKVPNELREQAHKLLLQHLDLVANDPSRMDSAALRPRVIGALRQIVDKLRDQLPVGTDENRFVGELADEALGLGPLEQLLSDPEVSEIMLVDPKTIYVERGGRCFRVDASFTDDARVRAVLERIVTPLGRRIDESQPLVDARLRDGSRVNAVTRPLSVRGTCITIRKFPKNALTLADLVELGSLSEGMGRFLMRSVRARKNIVVAGGTGSGKTTLLNVLSSAILDTERIVTIEDCAELQMRQPHVVSLETRPANLEGVGAYTVRDLVRNALRMRPDRIVVGECRAGEALDMLQAMNTGHEGALTTVHANSPKEAVSRLETLCLMAGLSLPIRAIREQIAASVHLIVQQQRMSDGSRKVVEISEIEALDRAGDVRVRPLYRFEHGGIDAQGRVQGRFGSTGYLPSYLGELLQLGLIPPGEGYL